MIGRDPITGRKLESWERGASVAAILGRPLVKGVKHGGKILGSIASGVKNTKGKTVHVADSATPINSTKQQAPSQANKEASATTASPAKSKEKVVLTVIVMLKYYLVKKIGINQISYLRT